MGLDGHRVATEGRCGDPACRRPRGCRKRTQKRVGAGKKNAGTWSCKGQKRAGPLRGVALERERQKAKAIEIEGPKECEASGLGAGRPRPIRVGARTQAAARFFPEAGCRKPWRTARSKLRPGFLSQFWDSGSGLTMGRVPFERRGRAIERKRER